MNVSKISLPDGGLVRIEGADAHQVASILSRMVANEPLVSNVTEQPLPLPSLTFSKSDARSGDDESPLELPRIF
jgi:hypothetical protein